MTTEEDRDMFVKELKKEMIEWLCKHHMLTDFSSVPRTKFPNAETKIDIDSILVKLRNKEINFKQIEELHEKLVLSGTDMVYLWAKSQEHEFTTMRERERIVEKFKKDNPSKVCLMPEIKSQESGTETDVIYLLEDLESGKIDFEQIKDHHKQLLLSGTDMIYIWIKMQSENKL